MARIIRMTHAFGTIKISPAGNGEDRDTVDARVNAKLAEGYDEVTVIPLRSNFNTDGAMTDVVNQYIFVEYEKSVGSGSAEVEEKPVAKRKTKASGD